MVSYEPSVPSVRSAILWGGLVAGILDAVDGVIAFATQGLNPIQVLQYIASGALGRAAFEGGLATAALGAGFHFAITWVAAAVFVLASEQLALLKTQAVATAVDAALCEPAPDPPRIGQPA